MSEVVFLAQGETLSKLEKGLEVYKQEFPREFGDRE